MTYIKNHSKDIFIFLVLIVIVTLLQINLLEPHLHYGFTADDWWPLAHYKFIETSNLLSNIWQVWKQEGVYTSYQVLYITILHNFFGFDFQSYQLTNHILKTLSALALYPMIVIVFKNRLLAFITTILYAMAYSPVGTLEIVAKGSDFISIVFMCIFFILYYYKLIGVLKGGKWTFLLLVTLSICMMLSAIRMYPILAFILGIEIYFFAVKRTKKALVDGLKRLLILFSPYLLMFIISPYSILRFLHVNAPAIIERIEVGNWQLILHPFGSFGSLFLLNDYWKLFGLVNTNNFGDYIVYLITNPLIIYLFIALFYLVIISIPAKQFLKSLLIILSINILFQLIIFFIATHWQKATESLKMNYDPSELYSVFFAIFILILGFFIWKEWYRGGKKNNLLFALWIGPIFAFTFIVLTWILADFVSIFKGSHSYLTVPAIGSSLFIGGTLVLFYEKIKIIKVMGKFLGPLVFLLLIPIFNINNNAIQSYLSLSSYSMNAQEQDAFRDRLWNQLKDFDNTKPSLFYFNTLEDQPNGRFYEQSILGRFSEWMFFKGNYTNKCLLPVFIMDKLDQLKPALEVREGEVGFYYRSYCGKFLFIPIKDFYAFLLINKQPIDIKNKVLIQLGISKY